jgi:outer membrane protein
VVRRSHAVIAAAIGVLMFAGASSASAETIVQALASAYSWNPEINSARAQTRADDENVPIARGGYTPVISLFSTTTGTRTDQVASATADKTTGSTTVGMQVSQDIFSGFRVRNGVRQAEVGVLASREVLRNTVENVLFDAAQAYMDVLRDTAILDIRHRNVLFLEEQVRAANERYDVGENTRTDVAQARARLAQARAAVSLAESNLSTSRATYRQVIGHDPNGLADGFPFGRLVPNTVQEAVGISQDAHPLILAAIHQADAQGYAVKKAEGELLPEVSLQGTVQHNESYNGNFDPNSASIVGRLTIPLYPGGAVYGQVRQSKELYGLRKIEIDVARDRVRAAVVTAWAQVAAAVGAISAANEGVDAAGIALSGVQEEQRVGQRTTLDVLDAQQELLSARETAIVAHRDRVVASFALLSAMGRLTAEQLSLPTEAYDPTQHYRAVRSKLIGVRTPDGR